MSKLNKMLSFLDFSYNQRLPRIARRMKDAELIELYEEFSPLADTPVARDNAMGTTVIYVVSDELKRRYPSNKAIQDWDASTKINLREIIGA